MIKRTYIKNDIAKLKSIFRILNDLEYDIEFLKKYSEYVNIAKRVDKTEDIFKKNSPKLEKEPFFYIQFFTIPTLKLISKNKNILIKEYKGESFEKDINLIISNLIKLSKKLYCVNFEEQFLSTQDIFNNFLDKINTTIKGNTFFIKTDIANIFHTILFLIKNKKENENINSNPLELAEGFDIYGSVIRLLDISKEDEEFFPTSDSTKNESDFFDMLNDWINKPVYTKNQMMGPIRLIEEKITEIYGNDMVYTPYKKEKNTSPETNEEIILKNIGIVIKGREMIKKLNSKKKILSKSQKELIYFLYSKYKQNPNECFDLKYLTKIWERDKTEKTLRNIISSINSTLIKLIDGDKNSSVGKIIIRGKKKSYQLNPKLVI